MAKEVVNKLIAAFVLLILGVSLIGTVASQALTVTDKKVITNEADNIATARAAGINQINESSPNSNITVTNAPTGWKQTDCILTSVTFGNSSTDWTAGTDYVSYPALGIISLRNTTATNTSITNTTNVDYTYCGDDYLNSSWGRTTLLLVGGFFALVILAGSLWLFYGVGKDTGIIN